MNMPIGDNMRNDDNLLLSGLDAQTIFGENQSDNMRNTNSPFAKNFRTVDERKKFE